MILNLSILSYYNIEVKAEALPIFHGTLADVIVSTLTAAGGTITEQEWVSGLYNAFESIDLETCIQNGWLTLQNGSYIDTGLSNVIEQIPEYADLGLDSLFSLSASENVGGAAMSGAALLASQFASVSVTGTILPLVGAVGAGVTLGVLANKFVNWLGSCITNNISLTDQDIVNMLNQRIPGGNIFIYNYSSYSHNCICSQNCVYGVGTDHYLYCLNLSSNNSGSVQKVRIYLKNNNYQYTDTWNVTQSVQISSDMREATDLQGILYNQQAGETVSQWLNRLRATGIQSNPSNNVNTVDGNATGIYEDGEWKIPSIIPSIKEDEGLDVINKPSYLKYIGDVNQNNTDDNKEDNPDLYKDLINNHKTASNPDPDPDPDPDYNTDTPPQPDYDQKETASTQDIDTAGDYTTPNLQDKFPFCIPWDLKKIFTGFKSGREAPEIEWHFYVEGIVDYTFRLSLSDFDSVATILRSLELILFVVGLAVGTRNLLGA